MCHVERPSSQDYYVYLQDLILSSEKEAQRIVPQGRIQKDLVIVISSRYDIRHTHTALSDDANALIFQPVCCSVFVSKYTSVAFCSLFYSCYMVNFSTFDNHFCLYICFLDDVLMFYKHISTHLFMKHK